MDVTQLLNTASMAAAEAAGEGKLDLAAQKRRDSDGGGGGGGGGDDDDSGGGGNEERADALQTPSVTRAGSTAPSSVVATPSDKTPPSRRSSGDARTPNRNRTPWDAGGYSLSLALDNTKNEEQAASPQKETMAAAAVAVAAALATTATAPLPETMAAASSCGSPLQRSTSPRHKFSDSRSSFSSAYTNGSSTNNSVSHSRISSLSTVSENQPLTSLITDLSLSETHSLAQPGDSSCMPAGHLHHHHHHNHQQLHGASLAAQLASPVSENQQQQQQQQQHYHHQQLSPHVTSPHNRVSVPADAGTTSRGESPSDTMLIPRAASSQIDDDYPPPGTARLLHLPFSHARSSPEGDLLSRPLSSPTRRHKRAVSAPDFSSVGSTAFNPRFPTFGPIPEPTPSPSQHSDGDANMEHDSSASSPTVAETQGLHSRGSSSTDVTPSAGSSMVGSVPSLIHPTSPPSGSGSTASPPTLANVVPAVATNASLPTNFSSPPVCMYRNDCQTGSQLRKAISHIFGRNKLCTRMIPTGVWVHYCRKHYQRTRYRNGGEYPQRQIGLVQLQIRRVQAWSDANTAEGMGPVLRNWSLSVRKREQLRLESCPVPTSKKRPFRDDGDDERADLGGTAVPDWIVAHLGDGFSTPEILTLVDRLKADIDLGRMTQVPDIEILPNIVNDLSNEDPNTVISITKKTYAKRRPTSQGHRRAQSVNTSAVRSADTLVTMSRRESNSDVSMAASGGTHQHRLLTDDLCPREEKRPRFDAEEVACQHGTSMGLGYGSRVQLPHRPAFAAFNAYLEPPVPEHQLTGGSYDAERRYKHGGGGGGSRDPRSIELYGYVANANESRRDHERHHSATGFSPGHGYGVLPAPNPQRFGGPPMVQQLERSYFLLNSAAHRHLGGGDNGGGSSGGGGGEGISGSLHQRSQSEAGGFHHLSSVYGCSSTSGRHGSLPFSNLPRLSTNVSSLDFTKDESRSAGYAGGAGLVHQHMEHGSLSAGPVHGHSHPSHYASHAYHHRHHGSYGGPVGHSGYSGDERVSAPVFDKFENVTLPPLQSVHLAPRVPAPGDSNVAGEHRSFAGSDYPEKLHHSRSPAVPPMRLATMEVGGAPSVSVPSPLDRPTSRI